MLKMGLSSDLFLRMTESEYFLIPSETRERHLSSKIVSDEKSDWSENMNDELYSRLYNKIKVEKKMLQEREYQLRENRIKLNK